MVPVREKKGGGKWELRKEKAKIGKKKNPSKNQNYPVTRGRLPGNRLLRGKKTGGGQQ